MLDTGRLDRITTFPALIDYLRDQLDWPIEDFTFDDLTYDWEPREFGLSTEGVSGQIEIKQLRPMEREPWGIFFLSLPHKKLPITILRRILGGLAIKKRASSNPAERAAWNKDDLFFIAAHGAGDERGLAFAHFHDDPESGDLPTLKVLGWDGGDTIRRLSDTHHTLRDKLHWRDRGEDDDHWRSRWIEAFREKPGESIATSKALANELARLAREIRQRANELLAEETDSGPLRTLYTAFKEALIHDLKLDDFADMYAQTIAYGLLAARISRESGALVADNAADLAPPTNPFLKELLQTFLSAGGRKGGMDFDELGVNDVVEMLRRADMHAVLLDFGTKNPSEDPVIHFYELFLKEYDAQKRMQRGVFYTPRPVVSFIVRSVDEVLRTEFGLEDGLASTATWREVIAAKPDIELPNGASLDDPFVRILDPATGTGTFLVEVVDLIHARMTEKWRKAGKRPDEIESLWNDYVPEHLLPRLYGFELMMAPYAIAHMKLGLKLAETDYHFRSNERARIYLTNALEPAQDFDMQLAFMSEALAHEAQAANRAKLDQFSVVIGNPPYANYGQMNRNAWISELLADYKRDLGEKKLNLDDDYIKFIRLSHYTVSRCGTGILGLITNSSYLDGQIHRVLRASLLHDFSDVFVADLHGNSRRVDESGGTADENVFAIQQGVAILVASSMGGHHSNVRRADLWGTAASKAAVLAQSTAHTLATHTINAAGPKFFFYQQDTAYSDEYGAWPGLNEVFRIIGSGLKTDRDELCIDFEAEPLRKRMTTFFSGNYDEGFVRDYRLTPSTSYDPVRLARQQTFDESAIRPFIYRPFDFRQIYYRVGFTSRPVFEAQGNMLHDNVGLLLSRQTKEDFAALASRYISTHKIVTVYDNTSLTPLWLRPSANAADAKPNIESDFLSRFSTILGLALNSSFEAKTDLQHTFGPGDVFDWIYAVLYSPSYRSRYADYLKTDFARIPLPGSKALFQELVPLGTKLVALHLLDVDGAPELKDPQGVRFAGHGEARVEKAPEWSAAGGNRVILSNHRWFEGVPERAWNFHIGGYQPAQKWLKDRASKGGKKPHPGRVLTLDDQLHYRRMIVAMDKTIDLMAEIDGVIDEHGGWPPAFKGMDESIS